MSSSVDRNLPKWLKRLKPGKDAATGVCKAIDVSSKVNDPAKRKQAFLHLFHDIRAHISSSLATESQEEAATWKRVLAHLFFKFGVSSEISMSQDSIKPAPAYVQWSKKRNPESTGLKAPYTTEDGKVGTIPAVDAAGMREVYDSSGAKVGEIPTMDVDATGLKSDPKKEVCGIVSDLMEDMVRVSADATEAAEFCQSECKNDEAVKSLRRFSVMLSEAMAVLSGALSKIGIKEESI